MRCGPDCPSALPACACSRPSQCQLSASPVIMSMWLPDMQRCVAVCRLHRDCTDHSRQAQVNLWGLDAIKTKGESVAIALYMVGARPVREGTGRIARFDALHASPQRITMRTFESVPWGLAQRCKMMAMGMLWCMHRTGAAKLLPAVHLPTNPVLIHQSGLLPAEKLPLPRPSCFAHASCQAHSADGPLMGVMLQPTRGLARARSAQSEHSCAGLS